MRIMTSIVASACVAAITAHSPAQFVFESAWRNVRVNFTTGQPILTVTSTELGLFQESLVVSVPDGPSATQSSSISPAEIQAQCAATLAGLFTNQTASSGMTTVFHVERPTLFVLTGTAAGGTASTSGAGFGLFGGSIDFRVSSRPFVGPQELPGLLLPGASYTAYASADSFNSSSSFLRYSGSATMQLTTFPGSPQQRACEITRAYGEVVGLLHISIAIATWGQSVSPGTEGDYDYDGVVTLSDIARILEVWSETCAP